MGELWVTGIVVLLGGWAALALYLPRTLLPLWPASARRRLARGGPSALALLAACGLVMLAASVACGLASAGPTGAAVWIAGILGAFCIAALVRTQRVLARDSRRDRETVDGSPIRPTGLPAVDLVASPHVPLPAPVDRESHRWDRGIRRVRALAVVGIPVSYVVSVLAGAHSSEPDGTQSSAPPFMYLVVVCLTVIAGTSAALRWRTRPISDRELHAVAARHGWSVRSPDAPRLAQRFPYVPLIRVQDRFDVVDEIRTVDGMSGGWQWWATDQYGAADRRDRRHQWENRSRRSTWIVWLAHANLPPLMVVGRDDGGVNHWSGASTFEFEAFDRAWRVRHGRGTAQTAHAVIHPRMIELIGRSMPDGGRLWIGCDAVSLTVDGGLRDVERNADFAVAIANLLPRWVLLDHTRAAGRQAKGAGSGRARARSRRSR